MSERRRNTARPHVVRFAWLRQSEIGEPSPACRDTPEMTSRLRSIDCLFVDKHRDDPTLAA
jgi:hypothetical protein